MKLMENVFRRTLPIVHAVLFAVLLGSIPVMRAVAQGGVPSAPQAPAIW